MSYASLSHPPLDFSIHRSSPDTCASLVLDLRVKKVGRGTDQHFRSRSMFEAYVANAGTPPSPPSPPIRSHGRTSSESTDDSSPVPSFQNSRQNLGGARVPIIAPLQLKPQAHQPRYDSPLHVTTGAYSPLNVSYTPTSRSNKGGNSPVSPSHQLSPHFQIRATPDTTIPVSGSLPAFPDGRHLEASQYYSAFRSLPVQDQLQNFAPSSRIPAAYLDSSSFYHLPAFSEMLQRDALKSEPIPVSGKTGNAKMTLESDPKSASEEPTSSFPEIEYSRVKPDTDGSGSDCEQGQLPVSSGSHESGHKDASYWERRRKNNEAAKKSRDSRRAKEDEIAVKAAVLEKENICLKLNLAALKKEHQRLRLLLE